MLLNLFSSRPDHPLAEVKELRRVIGELPLDHPYKAVDEVHGWFESLLVATDFRADLLFGVVRQLDEAAQPFLRRLARDCLQVQGVLQARRDEQRMATLLYAYWGELANLYTRCLDAARQAPKERAAEALKPSLPLIAARLIAARAQQLKWIVLRYGQIGEEIWRALGLAYLAADADGYAQKPVPLYPGQAAVTSAQQQYLRALVLASSSMDALAPVEIELADRLVEHALASFEFSAQARPDSLYWIDAAAGVAPLRLVQRPRAVPASARFFSSGDAPALIDGLLRQVERGEIPKTLNLGGEYAPRTLLPVLRHLARHWASAPQQRRHRRHAVQTRIAVLQGFDDCFAVLSAARAEGAPQAETWTVENVSLNGFGAVAAGLGERMRIGVLLALQPAGGENWVLGVVCRFGRDAQGRASVGIRTLSRQAQGVELAPRAAGLAAASAVPAIWLREGDAEGEMRFVLPASGFDVRQTLECADAEGGPSRVVLAPIELEESGSGFEIGRYRVRPEA